MSYSQRDSYSLVNDGYRLIEKKFFIGSVSQTKNEVTIVERHIWKSKGKKDKNFHFKKGWFKVPSDFIITKTSRSLANNYFQTDDMYLENDCRVIVKGSANKIIELYLKQKEDKQ